MLIKKVAIGDFNQAYIENELKNGVNVIFSDDNNRGKTLLIQGLMFSLGNSPIFPNGFNYKDYYFYTLLEFNGEDYELLRKGNSFFIRTKNDMRLFSSESEFRFYFSRNIIELPKIIKKGSPQTVSFEMFYEMFFIGQDNRNPSNIIYHGRFNKDDFKLMLCDLAGVNSVVDCKDEKLSIKKQLLTLKNDLKAVKKKLNLVKKNPTIASFTSKYQDLLDAQDTIKLIEDKNNKIAKLKTKRNRLSNRISKLKTLITELNSLNRTLSEGKLICGECRSDKIIYANKDLEFDVSNSDVKNAILKSIGEDIDLKSLIIDDLTFQINDIQDSLNDLMEVTPPDIFQVALFKDEILTQEEYSDRAFEIQLQIDALNDAKENNIETISISKVEQATLVEDISSEMMKVYESIDKEGILNFDDIFSKKDAVFSGSDQQEYYFCRLIALNNKLNHSFPIIVDSFRDGELSSRKEEAMLDVYNQLNKQVILTSTLKSEEYNSNKYSQSYINRIDYSIYPNHKLMGDKHLNDFVSILESFNIYH
ncbi:hypothetical protein MD588_18985 [Photobacterium sp. SDRW27]|uniref:hypothetical protein n=1 Tax=Photobacterium obscurum TaxID=2829490 RepID=UPI002243BB4A|nr:hypothetical protein [Photobacterium obscurum]MCW8330882.1 hypothetical protein [Photobacterium obscurum]